VLKTSAGTFSSEKLNVQTHKMTDLSGITITPGHMPAALRESLQRSVERIGAKIADTVRIDTTHFVCTDGRGPAWEKAVENNIPVVVPDWILGCEREGRIVGVRGYYLNADPRLRNVGPGASQQPPQAQSQQQQPQQPRSPVMSPRTEITPPTPDRPTQERDDEAAAPPPPPPKDDISEKSRSTTPEPKSQAEEQKVRTEDMKPQTEKDTGADNSEDDSEPEPNDEKALEAGLPNRPKPKQASAEDDEGDASSFQEVAL
jgi:chitin biosynthesis protein CHS5